MDLALQIVDIAGSRPDHSLVIVNFASMIRPQLKNSSCVLFTDNVIYKFRDDDGEDKEVIPDVSINCSVKQRRGARLLNAPKFIMEVLSKSTEKEDRTVKKELYRQQEVQEYWIVDIDKREIEIYELDYDQNLRPEYYLIDTINQSNKEKLKLRSFSMLQVSYDDIFADLDLL